MANSSEATTKTLAVLLCINILLLPMVSACGTCPPGTRPRPTPTPTPTTPTPSVPGAGPGGSCPRDALKLGICADLLGSLLNLTIGTPPRMPCCSLIQGLLDLEAAICLCTAIKANILGIQLNIPLSLSLLLNVCSRRVPPGFQCA